MLITIILPTVISLYIGTGLTGERVAGITIGGLALASNGLFYGLSRLRRTGRYYRLLGMSLLAFDVVFVSFFIYSKGGIESRSLPLYGLAILISAALFGRRGVYWTAAGSAVGYDSVILANYFGWVHSPEAVTHEATDLSNVVSSIVFFTAVLLLTGVLTDFLTRLLIRKEQEASQAAAALKRAQAIAKVGSWEWDMAADTITWSDELYNIFGIPRTEPVEYGSFQKRLHPEDRAWVTATINRSLKTRKPFSYDHRIVRPDKSVRIIHGEGKVLTGHRGNIVQLYGTAQDITAERELEAAKGDFVSLASHQLRTPASGVRMLLAMLRDGYAGTLAPEQLRTVEEAYLANERLLRIADDLLNVAKLESGRLVLNRQHLELCLWLKNSTRPQKLLSREHRQKLELLLPKGPVYVDADPERLGMVLDNLLSNARKYTPPRGTIRVILQPGQKAHKIKVSDTGSGMSKTEIGRLFGKFTRLDNPASKGAEGTGLGLFLSKSIVDLHGGSISVTSRPGAGSTFTISLPLKPAVR
ncbi:MAG: ATP-binding protein [Candidatus Saccharibacteria bacterium]